MRWARGSLWRRVWTSAAVLLLSYFANVRHVEPDQRLPSRRRGFDKLSRADQCHGLSKQL